MSRQAGRSLMGVLVGCVVLIGLTVVFATGGGGLFKTGSAEPPKRADGKGETLIGRSAYAAKDSVCRSNLGQVRQSIQINTDPVEEVKPAGLADLKLPSTLLECPVGKEPYRYDPATGTVTCPHPGHEKH